jgi:phenylacetic acid degradation protein
MNSVIMDDAEIGDECIVGAMSFVKAEEKFPKRKLIVGNPAKAIKDISDEMIAWKTAGTRLYQQLPKDCHESLKEVEPLREIPANRPIQEDFYKTISEFRNEKKE